MAKKKNKELSNEEIGALVKRAIENSTGFLGGTQLSSEREKVLKYMSGELPARQGKGGSSYVSSDVYDNVQGMTAQLLEVFGGTQEPVQFDPQNAKDVEAAREATEYCNYVFYRLNDGYQIVHDVAQDGLQARVAVAKVFWESNDAHQAETFEGLTEDEVDALAGDDEVAELDAEGQDDEAAEGETLYSGTLTRTKKKGRPTIEVVPPEEFIISEGAKDLTATHGQRTLKTKTQIEAMGFDVSPLKDVPPDGDEDFDGMSQEKRARIKSIDNGHTFSNDPTQDENKSYWFHEIYIRLIKQKGGREKLYKVVYVGDKVLDCQEVDRTCYFAFQPLKKPHSFFGDNFAMLSVPTANARTVLTRAILEHSAITTNPRYQVLQGGLTNPREMLDNRIGGIVNVTRPDAVTALDQPPLNPFVFQTLEVLKMNNEERTGISSLSQGLNKDAISNQNSQGMVQDLVALSQTRQKIVARNMGAFLRDIYLEIYRLAIENDDAETVMQVAGNFVPVDPKTWIERKDASVSFHLGVGAAQNEAMKYVGLMTMAQTNPQLQRMIGDQGLYNCAVKILNLQGVKDTQNYISDPRSLPPPQPDPVPQMEAQAAMAKAQADMAKAKATETKSQADVMKAQMEAPLKQAEFQLKKEVAESDMHRKDMESAHKIDIGEREMQVVENTPAEPTKPIASPNS